jgi:hypothetical protein
MYHMLTKALRAVFGFATIWVQEKRTGETVPNFHKLYKLE